MICAVFGENVCDFHMLLLPTTNLNMKIFHSQVCGNSDFYLSLHLISPNHILMSSSCIFQLSSKKISKNFKDSFISTPLTIKKLSIFILKIKRKFFSPSRTKVLTRVFFLLPNEFMLNKFVKNNFHSRQNLHKRQNPYYKKTIRKQLQYRSETDGSYRKKRKLLSPYWKWQQNCNLFSQKKSLKKRESRLCMH